MQINLNKIDWAKLGSYVLVIVLAILLFKACQSKSEQELANKQLQKDVKALRQDSQRYVDVANNYRDSVVLLKQRKQKVKDSIVYVVQATKRQLEKIPSSTKGIAKYYQERYKLPVVITKYGSSLSDNIARKNITELIQKDGCFSELQLTKKVLVIEEKSGVAKDSTIANLDKAIAKNNETLDKQEEQIKNAEKTIRREKTKKTFWQVATGAVLVTAGYLLVTQ